MKWQPIETAPRDGTVILAAHSGAVFDAWWDGVSAWVDGTTSDITDDFVEFYPTHWMPLPEPPTQEKTDEAK